MCMLCICTRAHLGGRRRATKLQGVVREDTRGRWSRNHATSSWPSHSSIIWPQNSNMMQTLSRQVLRRCLDICNDMDGYQRCCCWLCHGLIFLYWKSLYIGRQEELRCHPCNACHNFWFSRKKKYWHLLWWTKPSILQWFRWRICIVEMVVRIYTIYILCLCFISFLGIRMQMSFIGHRHCQFMH